jgi:DNA-binding PadR family transcriptional regulator
MYSQPVPPTIPAALSKDLVAASATSLILAILAEGDSYGYAILKRVSEVSGGHLQWTDGMLYPVLHRLERLGHVDAMWGESESGRRRRYYRITESGRAQLSDQKRQWLIVDAALRGVWSKRPPGGTARLVPIEQKGQA